jgi:hypothetical protein
VVLGKRRNGGGGDEERAAIHADQSIAKSN